MSNSASHKYYAFITYSHKDSDWAKWLQHELEYYKLPANINAKGALPESFRPVFRDEDELSGGDLKPQISEALANSEYLIVICSPNSARSKYVNSEILEFIQIGKNYGIDNKRRIFPFIVAGKPHQNEDHKDIECFTEALNTLSSNKEDPIELIAGDVNATGRNHAFVKILAGTLKEKNVRFSDLWNRYEEYKLEEEKHHKEEKNRLLLLESRFLSEKAMNLIEAGDSYLARLLILKALPQSFTDITDRPYCIEAESALRVANESQSAIFKGHLDGVINAQFSPNGKFIASLSANGSVMLWNTQNGASKVLPMDCPKDLEFIMFSPDSEKIALPSRDFTIRIWDVRSGKQIGQPLTGHTDVVKSAIYD